MGGLHHAIIGLDRQAQHVERTIHDAILDRKGIADIRIEHFRAYLPIGLGVHKSVGHTNLIAGSMQASLQHQTHSKVFPGLFHT